MGGDKMLPALVGLDPESGEAERIGTSRSELFRHELSALRPTPGARDLLELLRNEGLPLVVATSAQASEVQAILEQTSASSGDAERSKPDPDIVQAALRKAGSSGAHAIMLGDTPYDIEAAARARVATIALRCGGGWSDEQLAAAIAIYDDPADLHRHYDTSPLSVRA